MQEENKSRLAETKRLNLKRIIDKKSMKNIDLARAIDVKPPFISGMLSGSQPIGEKIIEKLCVALDVEERDFYDFSILGGDQSTEHIYKEGGASDELMDNVKKFIPPEIIAVFRGDDEKLKKMVLDFVLVTTMERNLRKSRDEYVLGRDGATCEGKWRSQAEPFTNGGDLDKAEGE